MANRTETRTEGLAPLANADRILIKDKPNYYEFVTREQRHQYKIFNSRGENIYTMQENSDPFEIYFYNNSRAFEMEILDNSRNRVLYLIRPRKCVGCCCCKKCAQILEVYAHPNKFLGTIEEKCHFLTPKYVIKNDADDPVLNVKAGYSTREFTVTKMDGEYIGRIAKLWSGFFQELLTDADNFEITFPLNMDVYKKALLIGATILIDFVHFENSRTEYRSPNRNRRQY